jgi:hypothetical protein
VDRYNACIRSSRNLNIAHIEQSLAIHFSEEEMFTVYDMLLSPGLHTITVSNIVMGRAILKLFLDSLNFHEYMYWLSESTVPSGVISMYQEMELAGCMQESSSDMYSWYLHNEPDMHMLIIECSQGLTQEQWYPYFEEALLQSSVYDYLPIIQVQYA